MANTFSQSIPDSTTADSTNQTQHNILISIPRTASNLLTHLLALPLQPSITAHRCDGYFFIPAASHRFMHATLTCPYESWSDKETKEMDEVLQRGVDGWQSWLEEASAEGKGTYTKEHVNWMISPPAESTFIYSSFSENYSAHEQLPENPTVVPDEVWTKVRATFLIRHPALVFPSAMRTAIDNEGLDTVLQASSETVQRWECTYQWHVLLYRFIITQDDAYSQQHDSGTVDRASNKGPIIIDASDLTSPAFISHYATLVGLDSSLVLTSWRSASDEDQKKLHKVERRMKDTLLSSNQVLKGKLQVGDIDLVAEREKWDTEFGPVLAERLSGLVKAALGNYNWLRHRRLQI